MIGGCKLAVQINLSTIVLSLNYYYIFVFRRFSCYYCTTYENNRSSFLKPTTTVEVDPGGKESKLINLLYKFYIELVKKKENKTLFVKTS